MIGLWVGRQGRTTGPEVEEVLPLSQAHTLDDAPEPLLEARERLLVFLCGGEEREKGERWEKEERGDRYIRVEEEEGGQERRKGRG